MKYPSDQYDPDKYRKPDPITREESRAVFTDAQILRDAAQIVQNATKRGWVKFPEPPTMPTEGVTDRIKADLAAGIMPQIEIAIRHNVSRYWVSTIAREMTGGPK